MNIVKRKRLDLEMTQKELGDKIGVKQATIARYEKTEAIMPSGKVLCKMSEVFGCTPNEILTGMQKNISASV